MLPNGSHNLLIQLWMYFRNLIEYITDSVVVFSSVGKVIRVLHFHRVQIELPNAETLLQG